MNNRPLSLVIPARLASNRPTLEGAVPNLPPNRPSHQRQKPEVITAHVENSRPTIFPSRRTLLRIAVALTAAAGLFFTVAPFRDGILPGTGAVRRDLAELVAAVGPRRTFEPRLTGGFKYGGLLPDEATRSGEPTDADLPIDLRSAAVALEKRAQGTSDPVAIGAFGTAQLLIGRSEKAVSTFEAAIRLSPNDPRLLSDLAAAYLVRSRDRNEVQDVAWAVGYARQAADADRSLAEAQFNLALALEGLSLRAEATRAWRAYLERDRNSLWTEEAKRHIERLAEGPEARWENQRREVITAAGRGDPVSLRAVTARFPDTVYDYVENDLTPAWTDAWLAHDLAKAKQIARRARAFGEALAETVGERMALDEAIAVEQALVPGNDRQADALALRSA